MALAQRSTLLHLEAEVFSIQFQMSLFPCLSQQLRILD